MKEELFQFISATFGVSFAVALIVLAIAFWLTHCITEHVTRIKTEHGDLNKTLEKAEKNIDEIRRDISFLKGSMDIVKGGRRDETSPLMQSHSPISLTKEGKQVANELDAYNLIDKNWSRIRHDLQKMVGKNAYDIQQYCIETADVDSSFFFDEETIDHVKMYAFRKGMPVQMYLRMLGLLIRDRFFEEQGIPLYEVDDNAPQKS